MENLNITAQLDSIEHQRHEAETKFMNEEISLYKQVLDFKFNFGKYKGKSIKEIIDIDKQYVYWAILKTNITGINLNIFHLNNIIEYYLNIKRFESYKRESEYKDRLIDSLMKDSMSYDVAYNCINNRNCRDFGM